MLLCWGMCDVVRCRVGADARGVKKTLPHRKADLSRFRLKPGRDLDFSPGQKQQIRPTSTPYIVILSRPYIVILSVSEGSAKVRGTNEKTEILRCAQDDLILLVSRFFSKMCDIAHGLHASLLDIKRRKGVNCIWE